MQHQLDTNVKASGWKDDNTGYTLLASTNNYEPYLSAIKTVSIDFWKQPHYRYFRQDNYDNNWDIVKDEPILIDERHIAWYAHQRYIY